MAYNARVVLDSISPSGVRLTTMEVTLPRFTLAEMNTHRAFSRNSASSRAVPTEKFIERALADPVTPIEWGMNMRGMSASETLPDEAGEEAERIWLEARDDAVRHARALAKLGVHKQIVNRILEPFLWHTMVITATDWANFYAQRLSPYAQPEIQHAAQMMYEVYEVSTPTLVAIGGAHLPFIAEDEGDLSIETRRRLSVARCARTSYLSQNGTRELDLDLALYDRLIRGQHWSPLEHQATPLEEPTWSGNFWGWEQFRKSFESENIGAHGVAAR
jgi:thymidylate synthase ThyX